SRTRPCTWSRVKGFCCAQADRAKTSPIASMRRVSVFRNSIATSQGSRGLGRVFILPQMEGIADFRLAIFEWRLLMGIGRSCQTTSSIVVPLAYDIFVKAHGGTSRVVRGARLAGDRT